MNIFELDIVVKTPLQIGDLSLGNVFRHSGYSYLSPSTVKGAILSKLYDEYGVEDVKLETTNPKISIRPAYPVFEGYETRPLHPLLHKCKLCRGEDGVFLNQDVFRDVDAVHRFRYEDFKPPYMCPNGHLLAVSNVRGLVVFKRGRDGRYRYIGVNLGTTQLESIGINRGVGGTELGMVYSYVALKPGVNFKAILLDREDIFRNWASEIPERDEYFIGRGVSRGMGLVEISIKELNYNEYINNRADEIIDVIHKLNGIVILRALSPVINNFTSYDIDLGKYGLAKHIIYRNGEKQYNYIPNGSIRIRGYSVRMNLPRVTVYGLAPGSLYFYKVIGKVEDVSRSLARLEVEGFAPPYNIGFNYLEVYRDVKYIL